jgi:hypothetical protein
MAYCLPTQSTDHKEVIMNRPQQATAEQVLNLSQQWAAAEVRGDTAFLDRILTEDVVGFGPLGFMLSKPEWLQCHTNSLAYQSLALEDARVRTYGTATSPMAEVDTRETL